MNAVKRIVLIALMVFCVVSTVGCQSEKNNETYGTTTEIVDKDINEHDTLDIEQIKDSVVMIETFGADGEKLGSGSGFSVFKSDWIATNMHVIEGARYIHIITDEGQMIEATDIVLYNKLEDLAILKIEGELVPLNTGNTACLKVKDKVTAIGSPMGVLNTVSEGIISNVDVRNEIRITAPISHGSSGGVLLNEYYEVIGITNAGYDEAQNLNFAIDIDVLLEMRKAYLDRRYEELTCKDLAMYIPHVKDSEKRNRLEISTNPPSSKQYNYTVDSLETFYLATNPYSIFDATIRHLSIFEGYSVHDSLHDRYSTFTQQQKKEAANNYTYLLQFETDPVNATLGNTTTTEISNWEIPEYILRLNLLSPYELAILMTDLGRDMFDFGILIDYMNQTNMSYEAKIIINRLYNNTDDRYNQDIIEYFNNNDDISYEQEAALLEYLGMTVDADGTVHWG